MLRVEASGTGQEDNRTAQRARQYRTQSKLYHLVLVV